MKPVFAAAHLTKSIPSVAGRTTRGRGLPGRR